ncbi:MAG: ATP-binding protein [Thermodesulfovibrionia bacterium]|nr:ATP-binding protein [Thermodesulfovibrionia bacterium]
MEDLSLHILDIAENSINAGASKIRIKIIENVKKNLLLIEIADNGKGMDENTIKMAQDPFFTTKSNKRVGLGIPFLAQSAREAMGDVSIKSKKGKGTTITATFKYNHIDRKPLGDIEKTLTVLIAGNPEVDFVYEHKRNSHAYYLDTTEIKKKLKGIPTNHPDVIKIIKDGIRQWQNDTKDVVK